MRRTIAVFAVAVLLLLGTTNAFGGSSERYEFDPKWQGKASASFMSSNVWRGLELNDNFVIQPSVGLQYKGFGAKIWSNWEENANELTETDIILNYNFRFKPNLMGATPTLGIGYAYYSWNFDSRVATLLPKHTHEIFFTAGFEDVPLKPKLMLFWDVDQGNGLFLLASIGYSFNLGRNIPYTTYAPIRDMTLDLNAEFSVNFGNDVVGVGDGYTNLHHGEVSAKLVIPLHKNVSLEPKVAYSFPLSNDAKNAMNRVNGSYTFYGGAALTFRF